MSQVIEHLDPVAVPWFGGEKLLHRLAHLAYVASEAAVVEGRIPFDPSEDEQGQISAQELFSSSPEARANVLRLRDHFRPLLLPTGGPVPEDVRLFDESGAVRSVKLTFDREVLTTALEGWIAQGCKELMVHVDDMVSRLGKDPNPYDGFRLVVGGRLGLHPKVVECLKAAVPEGTNLHRYREPDKANVGAPTVKMAAALGALALKSERYGAIPRSEKRGPFRYRVGRARHGQLSEALNPDVDYDAWYEAGASNKPVAEVLYMRAEDTEDAAADDPRITKAACELGDAAIGQRLYLRAVGPHRIELTVGPSGGEPDPAGPKLAIELKTGVVEPA
jgi:hypothetical protein